jgi:hypothetical protein
MNPALHPWQAAIGRLEQWADRKLEPAITHALAPSPHRDAISIDTRPDLPAPDAWAHCACCALYPVATPCTFTHTSPCDKPSCGQTWTEATA